MMIRRTLLALVFALSMALPASAEDFKVDAIHSSVVFRVKHMNTSFAYGRFNGIAGTFSLDESNPEKAKFDFTIKTDSIDTANPGRDTHLKNADFFNAKQYPTITFKSTSVKSSGTNVYDVTGDLTLHGVTKPITVTIEHTGSAKDRSGKAIAGIESIFTIKRSDFGMKGMIGPVGDEVRIMLSSEGGASK